MTARKPTTTVAKDHTEQADTSSDNDLHVPDDFQIHEVDPGLSPTPEQAAAVDVAEPSAVDGPTGTLIDGALTEPEHPLDAIPALADTRADINVTAVQNGHGLWTWTARTNDDDGRHLAEGGPHRLERLADNLKLLFGTDTVVALRATGLDKIRRLT